MISSIPWLFTLILLARAVTSAPLNDSTARTSGDTHRYDRRQARHELRIMALGASNVYGYGSDPENGFRKPLRDLLRLHGYKVNMVGSQLSSGGTMRNGAHEGYPGERIDGVNRNMQQNGYINRLPNVVVIHAGTNNCIQNVNVIDGHLQLQDMANYILKQSRNALVLLSTLPPLGDAQANARCQNVLNPNIRKLAQDMEENGLNVHLVEIGGPGPIKFADIGPDGVHFNNGGHRKVGSLFSDAIQWLDHQGRIGDALPTQWPDETQGGTDGPQTCEKKAGDAFGPVTTQFGRAGADNGPYVHSGQDMSTIKDSEDDKTFSFGDDNGIFPDSIFFAQLVKTNPADGRENILDDFVLYHRPTANDKLLARIRRNIRGDGTLSSQEVDFDVDDGPGCLTRGVRWGDVNNDGLDDYICIDLQGNMIVSINIGTDPPPFGPNPAPPNPPKFRHVGTYKTAPTGTQQSQVLLADIDGDGRLDYCITADNGDITCWRNGGTGDMPTMWQELGVVFTGKGMGDLKGTRFLDINGDHRDDWVWVDDTGKTRIFTNSRGVDKSLTPLWREATATHPGTGLGGTRARLKFGRIFAGENRGKDYILVERSPLSDKILQLHLWKNAGAGGTRLKGDGNRYCDMTNKGRMDLLWIWTTGSLRYWENQNPNGHLANPWTWGLETEIYNIGEGRDRRGLHLTDWNGDGKCDILYHDKHSGNVEWWRNDYQGGRFNFIYSGILGNCAQTIGFGMFDLPIRFADIDGDGRADWLCMERDGRTTGYLNKEGGMIDMGQIKQSEGHDRSNIRWADVDGDKRADMLWSNNADGTTEVWRNEGEVSDRVSGSKFRWTAMGKRYDGQSNSANQYFPDFDGNGRADIHTVNPLENTGFTWFNLCPAGNGSGQDDSDTLADHHEPKLPVCTNAYSDFCSIFDCTDPPFVDPPELLLTKRGAVLRPRAKNPGDYGGNSRNIQIGGLGIAFYLISLRYPNVRTFLQGTPRGSSHSYYLTRGAECEDTEVSTSSADDPNGPGILNPLPVEWETNVNLDHPFDLQTMTLFLEFIATGIRPGNGLTAIPLIPRQVVTSTWRAPNGLPVSANQPFGKINDLVMHAYGDDTSYNNFVPLRNDLNRMKGTLFGLRQPYNLTNWRTLAQNANQGDDVAQTHMETTLHEFFATFNYINEPDFLLRMNAILADIRAAFVVLESLSLAWRGVVPLWDQWQQDFFQYLVNISYDWAEGALDAISEEFGNTSTDRAFQLLRLVALLMGQLDNIRVDGHARPQ